MWNIPHWRPTAFNSLFIVAKTNMGFTFTHIHVLYETLQIIWTRSLPHKMFVDDILKPTAFRCLVARYCKSESPSAEKCTVYVNTARGSWCDVSPRARAGGTKGWDLLPKHCSAECEMYNVNWNVQGVRERDMSCSQKIGFFCPLKKLPHAAHPVL